MSANDYLRDATIRHEIGLHGLASGTVRKVLGLLAAGEKDLEAQIRRRLSWIADRGYDASDFTLRRLEANLLEIRKALREAYQAAGRELRSDLKALAGDESGFQTSLLSSALPAEIRSAISIIKPAAAELGAIVESRPFQGALLKDWARQLEQSAYTKVRGAVRHGMLLGESIDNIVRRVRGTKAQGFRDGVLAISRREAETVVRTAVSHVAASVKDDVMAANADILRGVVWLGTLDTRTCPVCGIRDGKLYTATDHRPIDHGIPWGAGPGRMHMQDRCTSLPQLKSLRELGFNAEDYPPATRASMNGQVSDRLDFAEWVKTQTAEVQAKVAKARR